MCSLTEGADRGSQRGCLLGKGGPESGAAPFDIDLTALGRGGFGVPNPRVEVSGLKPRDDQCMAIV